MDLFDFAENPESFLKNNVLVGFRLNKLEIYNWGTFDKTVWAFKPNGETALLTGDVGSGKSTVIDALTTLFVSPRKTAYNKAADASAKERTTTSYVLGYYGQKRALEGKGKPEALRGTNQYSVLLATFKDEYLSDTVTLAQFFWFTEKPTPSRFYVVSNDVLSIKNDFSNFNSDVKVLKASLKKKDAMVFDDYNHYADFYRKKLGNLKEQAIDLFQQTISMKKVEALTDFVRNNMLEESTTNEDVDKLLNHYQDLNTAHEAVVRARKQVNLLTPIYNDGIQYILDKEKQFEVENAQNGIDTWFAHKKTVLYKEKIAELETLLKNINSNLEIEQQSLNSIENNIKQIEIEISKNGGSILEKLKTNIDYKIKELGQRKESLKKYNMYAGKVNLPFPDTITVFNQNISQIPLLSEQNQQAHTNEQNNLTTASSEENRVKDQIVNIEKEISSLRSRKSNIPLYLILLRSKLCTALNISEEQLPFIGELLEVKESEAVWEGAIERLLNSFAISMAIPKQYYSDVVKWVNKESLGAKLVYYNIDISKKQFDIFQSHPLAVAKKLEIKPDSPFYAWLNNQVAKRFDYVCCDEISIFQQENTAITKQGQIKSNIRHEKDDRKAISDRTRYVLGFSNQKKIDALTKQFLNFKEEKEFYEGEKNNSVKLLNEIREQCNALTTLSEFTSFDMLNINSIQQEIDGLHCQIKQIESSNDLLKELKMQLKQFQEKLEKQKDVVLKKTIDGHDIEKDITNIQKELNKNETLLENEVNTMCYPFLENNKAQVFGNNEVNLDNISKYEKNYNSFLSNKYKAYQVCISENKTKIEKGMQNFKREYPNETREMDDTINSLNEFNILLEQLQKDGLPQFEYKFKQLLQNNVIRQITIFQTKLNRLYKEIKMRINDINNSLHSIDYNSGRYIKIECEDSFDIQIREFRSQLKACTEGAAAGFDDEHIAEQTFLQIKEIIERFKGRDGESEADTRWTNKVTDVRNWFIFSASERWRESDEEYEHYTDSGGKSGGQKEKLAYTILAASLVYNFGLNQEIDDISSFRFIAIDEAFLKSSDEAAKFGLELFKQLKFQLLVVTPLLKIATIEPFISHVGFVNHNDVTHQSSLTNISIDEYQKKRKEREENQYA